MSRNGWFVQAVVFLLLQMPLTLHASVAMELGLGSRATAMGGAFTAIADDFSAVYYNPAGLTQIKRAQLSMTCIFAKPDFSLSNRDLVNQYHRIKALRGIGGGVTYLDIPPVDPERTFGATIGLATDLGYLLGLKGLHFGLAFYNPFDWMSRQVSVSTTNTFPHFPMYVTRMLSPVINAGLACEILPNLSIGVGVTLATDLAIDTYAVVKLDLRGSGFVEGFNNPTMIPTVNRELEIDPAPNVGILWCPTEWLRLGATYRGRSVVDMGGNQAFPLFATISDPEVYEQLLTIDASDLVYANYFTPHSVSLGAACRLSQWLVSLDLTWNRWSDFVDGGGFIPGTDFENTWVPRIGVEYQVGKTLCVDAGYYYQPSPVPAQPEETNYLDFDKHVLSLGCTYTHPRPILRKRHLKVSGYFQYHFLGSRTIDKRDTGVTVTRNGTEFPEYGPSYEISGSIYHLGLEMTLAF